MLITIFNSQPLVVKKPTPVKGIMQYMFNPSGRSQRINTVKPRAGQTTSRRGEVVAYGGLVRPTISASFSMHWIIWTLGRSAR
jgi:hypothetical protein